MASTSQENTQQRTWTAYGKSGYLSEAGHESGPTQIKEEVDMSIRIS